MKLFHCVIDSKYFYVQVLILTEKFFTFILS